MTGPLGWIPFAQRDLLMQAAHADALARMPSYFSLASAGDDKGDVVLLTDFWKHPEVKSSVGFEFPGIHQLTGSCFPAGTPVRMADWSEKSVEDVVVGDTVVTHTGASRQVVDSMTRKYTGDMVTVRLSGWAFPLEMTADHKVAVWREQSRWTRGNGHLAWVAAEDLKEGDRLLVGLPGNTGESPEVLDVASYLGDRAMRLDDLMESGEAPVSNVGMAAYQCKKSGADWKGRVKLVRSQYGNSLPEKVEVNAAFGRLMGLYLAEGGCHEGRVTFTLNANEVGLQQEVVGLLRDIFGAEAEVVIGESRPNVAHVRCSNTSLAAFLKAFCPGNVYTKRVPAALMRSPLEVRKAVLGGWLDGDGYSAFKETPGKADSIRVQGVTVSADLARDMTALALSCGLRASCTGRKARKQSKAAFDVYIGGPKALAFVSPEVRSVAEERGASSREGDGNRTPFGYMRRVVKVSRRAVVNLPVYDFEVEEDHSFVAGGVVVHNCVGAGGGNCVFTLACVEVVRLQDPEQALVPFWLYPYGRSRYRGGMRGRGEGSLGSTFADAIREDGVVPATDPGLPPFSQREGLVWGESAELQWSDGESADANVVARAKRFVVKSTAPCRDHTQVRAAIQNYFPCTAACSLFVSPGGARVTDGVCLGRLDSRGGHQTSILGWMKHPRLGDLYLYANQWGFVYPQCPTGAPRIAAWITAADMDRECSEGEVYAFSQFNGFPGQPKLLNHYI